MNPQVQVTKALCQGRGRDHHLHGRIMFCVWHEERPRRFLITVREYLTLSLPVPGSGACFAGADPGTARGQAVRTGADGSPRALRASLERMTRLGYPLSPRGLQARSAGLSGAL